MLREETSRCESSKRLLHSQDFRSRRRQELFLGEGCLIAFGAFTEVSATDAECCRLPSLSLPVYVHLP